MHFFKPLAAFLPILLPFISLFALQVSAHNLQVRTPYSETPPPARIGVNSTHTNLGYRPARYRVECEYLEEICRKYCQCGVYGGFWCQRGPGMAFIPQCSLCCGCC